MVAFENFKAGVDEVQLLLDVCSAPPALGKKVDRDNAVHRASVVLLVSHFESFLRLIVESFSDTIGDGRLESRQIPKRIRELHTLPRLTEILNCNDDTQRAVLLKKLQPLMALWNESAKPPPGTLSASVLSREVTNADSETIDRLFAHMGNGGLVCDGELDVPAGDGEIIPSNIRFGLKDVVTCRNDIAHGDSSRRPTNEDVDRYIRFLSALARRLDGKSNALIQLVT